MGSLPHDLSQASCMGLAIGGLLRQRYPFNTAKHIARDLSAVGPDCSVKTAENILAGHLSGKTITRLTLAYGLGFLIEAGARVTGKTLEQFIKEQAASARREAEAWDHLLGSDHETDPAGVPEHGGPLRGHPLVPIDPPGAARDQSTPLG